MRADIARSTLLHSRGKTLIGLSHPQWSFITKIFSEKRRNSFEEHSRLKLLPNGPAVLNQSMQIRIDPQIYYLALLPNDSSTSSYSIMHGFSKSLLHRSGWIREILVNCPATAHEAFNVDRRTMALRLACITQYSISFLNSCELAHVRTDPMQTFWVVLADDETRNDANSWVKKMKCPVLIATPATDPQSNSSSLNFPAIRTHVQNVLKTLDPKCVTEHGLDHILNAGRPRSTFKVALERTNNNIVLPNELALCSVGGIFARTKEQLCGGDEIYYKQIVESATLVQELASQIGISELHKVSPIGPTLIITCPSMQRHVAAARPSKGKSQEPFARILRMLQRQTTYALQIENQKELDELLSEPESVGLLTQRMAESSTYTDAVAARAASYICPVVRLPPHVNHIHPHLKSLRSCLFANQPQSRKIAKVVKNLDDAFCNVVPSELMGMIDDDQTSVKLISDAPLEWVPIRGLPLTLRHSVSRIPATPGNLSFQLTLPRPQLDLTFDAFTEVLVVRSYSEADRIRRDLETAITSYQLKDDRKLPVRFQDVRNSSELVDALAEFNGAMMIYDGHGTHGIDGIARLRLADEDVNLWELSRKINCPPIVFACGCDTHRADGSHVTTANGFLNAGAMSVIASAMPIFSDRASIFVGRLLFNIFEFVRPLITDRGYSIRFDRIFGSVQKMMYVSDFIWQIAPFTGFEIRGLQDLHIKTNMDILDGHYDWFETFLASLGDRLGRTPDEVAKIGHELLPFAECLKYFHLGNPDLIVIRPTGTASINIS